MTSFFQITSLRLSLLTASWAKWWRDDGGRPVSHYHSIAFELVQQIIVKSQWQNTIGRSAVIANHIQFWIKELIESCSTSAGHFQKQEMLSLSNFFTLTIKSISLVQKCTVSFLFTLDQKRLKRCKEKYTRWLSFQ